MTTKPGDDPHVLPHGPIERLAENLWWVQGSFRGMSLKRVISLLGSAPGPRISRLVKLLFVDDRAAFQRDLEGFAETKDLVRMMVAHEKVAHGPDAAAVDTPQSVPDIGSRRDFAVIT